ncbi:hypothetical protein JT359_18340 [Candidatus Poribacteria bacterium]|nr:hypothetical protein [Candidatus Poribacteria bacterium]
MDELFYDDTPERLKESVEKLENIQLEKQELENEKKELSDEFNKIKTQLNGLESMKKKLEGDLGSKNKEIIEKNIKIKTTTTQLLKSKERLKKTSVEKNEAKERIETLEEQLDCMESTNKEIKSLMNQLSTKTDELNKNKIITDSLSTLLTITNINRSDNTIFPENNNGSSVRMIDRRRTDRKNYLFSLLKMKQPSIYYVNDVDKIYQYLTNEIPEITDTIETHKNSNTEDDEKEILGRLQQREINTIVSDGIFSLLPQNDINLHIVFCNLSLNLDIFLNRCQPAFLLQNHCFIHLIYDSNADLKYIKNNYPDKDKFVEFYKDLTEIQGINTRFIPTESILSRLRMEKDILEPLCNIFQDIGMIQKKW